MLPCVERRRRNRVRHAALIQERATRATEAGRQVAERKSALQLPMQEEPQDVERATARERQEARANERHRERQPESDSKQERESESMPIVN